MAYPIELTIGTGNRVTVNYQSQEVSVSLIYQLERGDSDVLAVAREKAPEVVSVHLAAWESVRGIKPQLKLAEKATEVRSKPTSVPMDSQSAETYASTEKREGMLGAASGETIIVTAEAEAEAETAMKSCPNAGERNCEPSTAGQRMALKALLAQSGAGEEEVQESLSTRYGCESFDELSYAQACERLLELQRAERERVRSQRNKLVSPTVCLNGKGNG